MDLKVLSSQVPFVQHDIFLSELSYVKAVKIENVIRLFTLNRSLLKLSFLKLFNRLQPADSFIENFSKCFLCVASLFMVSVL